MVSNVYSKSYVQGSAALHQSSEIILFERLLPLLHSIAESGTAVNMHELNFAATMDGINAYLFGLENGTNFINDEQYRKHWLHLYHCRRTYTFFNENMAKFTRTLQKIGVRLIPRFVDDANHEIGAWLLGMCQAAQKTVDGEKVATRDVDKPTVYAHLSKSLMKHEELLRGSRELSVASEML